MKVREAASAPKAGRSAIEGGKAPEGPASFFETVKNAEERGVVERLRQKAAEISAQGEKLADRIDIKELRLYKKLISDFMDEAVGNSRKFSKQSFLDRRGRHKVYAIIKKINEDLDELTLEVLRDEKDHIKILMKLDEIKGLILDLAM